MKEGRQIVYYTIQKCKQIYKDRPMEEGGGEWQEEGITKGCEETFDGDVYIHYLDSGEDFMGIYM